MTENEWTGTVLAFLLAALIALWVIWGAAARLDRLHRRVRESRATLDAQLVRRATAALDLATADVLDPVSAVLVAEAAREALDRTSSTEVGLGDDGEPAPAAADLPEDPEPDQAMAESELSRVLRAALGRPEDRAGLAVDAGAGELLGRLEREWFRVQVARRFHNLAVVQTQRIRAKSYVRLLRLAGHAPAPHTFEMDDETP